MVLVGARRRARAGGLPLIGVPDAILLLLRLAVLVLVDLGADALADAMVVAGGAGRVGVDIAGALFVVVIRADCVLAALDYLGDPCATSPGLWLPVAAMATADPAPTVKTAATRPAAPLARIPDVVNDCPPLREAAR